MDYIWLICMVICVLSIRGAFMLRAPPGFRCDDPHIRHPFRGDSITLTQLLTTLVILPAVLLLLMEWSAVRKAGRRDSVLARTCAATAEYLTGLQLVAAATELIKALVMELRPHFIASCRPDWTNINCSRGLVTEYSCTSHHSNMVHADMYKSFPSGHASLSFYFFAFLTMYSNSRLQDDVYSGTGRRCLQVVAALAAVVCSASRIYDRRHHIQDVLFGAILGLLGGIVTIRWFAKSIRRDHVSTPAEAQATKTRR